MRQPTSGSRIFMSHQVHSARALTFIPPALMLLPMSLHATSWMESLFVSSDGSVVMSNLSWAGNCSDGVAVTMWMATFPTKSVLNGGVKIVQVHCCPHHCHHWNDFNWMDHQMKSLKKVKPCCGKCEPSFVDWSKYAVCSHIGTECTSTACHCSWDAPILMLCVAITHWYLATVYGHWNFKDEKRPKECSNKFPTCPSILSKIPCLIMVTKNWVIGANFFLSPFNWDLWVWSLTGYEPSNQKNDICHSTTCVKRCQSLNWDMCDCCGLFTVTLPLGQSPPTHATHTITRHAPPPLVCGHGTWDLNT